MWNAAEAVQLAVVKRKSCKHAKRAALSVGEPLRSDVDSEHATPDTSPALSCTSGWLGQGLSEAYVKDWLTGQSRDRVELRSPSGARLDGRHGSEHSSPLARHHSGWVEHSYPSKGCVRDEAQGSHTPHYNLHPIGKSGKDTPGHELTHLPFPAESWQLGSPAVESLQDYDEEGILDDAISYDQFPKGY